MPDAAYGVADESTRTDQCRLHSVPSVYWNSPTVMSSSVAYVGDESFIFSRLALTHPLFGDVMVRLLEEPAEQRPTRGVIEGMYYPVLRAQERRFK